MSLEKKIIKNEDVQEYSIFGWEIEGSTPEGAVILKRDKEDPNIKKYLNLELKYDSIKDKIKRLEMPVKPKNDGRIFSMGVCVLLAICLFPIGLIFPFYKPGMTKYEDEMNEYKKQLRMYEADLEDIRMQVQYIL